MNRYQIFPKVVEPLILGLITIASFGTITSAQQNSNALKFDELTVESGASYAETEQIVGERIKRFVQEAKQQRSRLKYLVYYRGRVRQEQHFYGRAEGWAAQAQSSIATSRANYDASDVLILDGGIRHHETLEFWFVKRGELPVVVPTFERSAAIDCPAIIAYQSNFSFDKAEPVGLKAEVKSDGQLIFDWTVNEGRIIRQNGGLLEVDVSGSKRNRLTAILDIRGLPVPCRSHAIVDAEFGNIPRLIDSFGIIPNGDFRGRADSFLTTIANLPGKRGYIYIYGNRAGTGLDSTARKRLLSNHIQFRGFDAARIKIVEAGFRESTSTDYWLVPDGVDPPIPKPSVDSRFVIKGPTSRPAARRRSN